jgi:hypothetical protein
VHDEPHTGECRRQDGHDNCCLSSSSHIDPGFLA